MTLTRDFKETVLARAARDPRFREALLSEAVGAFFAGDAETGRAVLRDLINASVGFEALAAQTRIAPKSLHRMLSPRGNPTTENFFAILGALQRDSRLQLRVSAAPASRRSVPARAYAVSARATPALRLHERAPAYRKAKRKKA